MEWDEFIDKVKFILKRFNKEFNIDYSEDSISYTVGEKSYEFSKSDYNNITNDAMKSDLSQFTVLTNNSYEVIIYQTNKMVRRLLPYKLEERIVSTNIKDSMNNIEYKFQEISDVMVWNIIKEIDLESLKRTFMIFPPRLRGDEGENLFNLLRVCFRNPYSLIVSYKKDIDKNKLNDYINSFLFNFCYNYGYSFRIMNSLDELLNIRYRNKNSSYKSEELDAPRLLYKQDLTEQYHMAVSSEDPFVQFIGFYHIMEYFYEEIYKEGVVNNVKEILLDPGFSTKRKKDIMKLVDLINKKRTESTVGSELEALELTLRKYIDIEKIIEKLNEIDEDIIEYYKNNKVNFSNGDAIDLIGDKKHIFKKLANRVYKTRNSLVHSKSNEVRLNERGIYKPFKDSKALLKEIPLLK
ncbi:hypothetical protein VYH70_04995 [Streptococcus anginosus]|uniref:Uncharacterized protein n=1 Tax=Criibacterium bergeronii TaxID=1871336 RepID=A0A371IL50_9FIRM|nr:MULTISPECIES: hypothetical protein [Bacillota]MBS4882665.1 hypothetical protein [Peptoniphilus harei]MDU5587686.1 hypothetical protein [Finegoldia magna]MDU7142977.1 hypothetical protein [Anaerococcus vaginalis]HBC4778738.1 hypothetical protein [Enterococcus faecalis]HER5437335.1 hypothetical protein [Streptococcus pyogenes]